MCIAGQVLVPALSVTGGVTLSRIVVSGIIGPVSIAPSRRQFLARLIRRNEVQEPLR